MSTLEVIMIPTLCIMATPFIVGIAVVALELDKDVVRLTTISKASLPNNKGE